MVKTSVNPVCSQCGEQRFFDNSIWLNTKEASEYLRISIGSLKNFVYRGVITPRKLGRLNRFKRDELDRLLERSQIGGNNAAI